MSMPDNGDMEKHKADMMNLVGQLFALEENFAENLQVGLLIYSLPESYEYEKLVTNLLLIYIYHVDSTIAREVIKGPLKLQ